VLENEVRPGVRSATAKHAFPVDEIKKIAELAAAA